MKINMDIIRRKYVKPDIRVKEARVTAFILTSPLIEGEEDDYKDGGEENDAKIRGFDFQSAVQGDDFINWKF